MFTLPIDIDELDGYQAAQTTCDAAPASLPSNPVPHRAAPHQPAPQGAGSDGYASLTNPSGGPDSVLRLAIEEQELAAETEGEKQYSPQLLRQARARVVEISSGLGQLKRAAGAESVADQAQEGVKTFEQRSAHLSLTSEDNSAAAEVDKVEKAGSGFANLFTRLRNMRGR